MMSSRATELRPSSPVSRMSPIPPARVQRAEIAETDIVDENDNDVGAGLFGTDRNWREGQQRRTERQNSSELHLVPFYA